MGREVRMVPKNWEHPKSLSGRYVPLLGRSYWLSLVEWKLGKMMWDAGYKDNWHGGWEARSDEDGDEYEDWGGECPMEHDYMPDWPNHERTHVMMYEDTSEGTPISPAFATPEELAEWLANNRASACGYMTATYEQWLGTIKAGWAPSLAGFVGGTLQSGVAYMGDREQAPKV